MRRTRALAATAAIAICTTLLTATPAAAATISATASVELAGESSKSVTINKGVLVPFGGVVDTAINAAEFFDNGDTDFDVFGLQLQVDDIDFGLEFEAPTDIVSSYTDGLLIEGEEVDVEHALSAKEGSVRLTATVHGEFGVSKNAEIGTGVPFDPEIDFGTVPCTIPTPGTTEDGCVFAANLPIVPIPVVPGIVTATLTLGINATVNVTPDGFATVREYEVVPASSSSSLSFPSADAVDDPYTLPCLTAGKELTARFTDSELGIDPTLTPSVRYFIAWDFLGGDLGETVFVDEPLGTADFSSTTLTDGGPDASTLGEIGLDETPPVVSVPTSFEGDEGTPIEMTANVDDPCAQDDVVWSYSDGSKEYGTSVDKTFADDGPYTGNVTATDLRGNKTVKNFSVDVDNVAPVAAAGLDTVADWGRPVAFSGQASDDGVHDLGAGSVYTWNFGDGSPPATGAKDLTHAYAAPGDYTATLTVIDKDGSSDTDTRAVKITKRDVTVSYLGATNATYDTATSLRASLVDEYGENVSGRSVAFEVDDVAKGSSNTGSNGVASVAYTPTEGADTYDTDATFAGDALYNADDSAGSITIHAKATSVTYTGAVTGGPNKTVTLSAKLVDATGKAVANKTIAFQLGSQATSATTNASGIAAVSLKLAQKNGTYPLTATYAPVVADQPKYVGSASSGTFKLQAK